jgi:ribose-phosphate pyrophosphokinase
MAGAYKVHVVTPYLGYARQDKKGKTRSALGARVIAKTLEANGADSVLCVDLHASQIQGFFSNSTPVIEVEGKDIFAPILKDEVNEEDWLICSPDAGGGKRAKAMKDQLGLGMVLMDKTRDKPNSIGNMVLIGDVTDKKVIIVDDMVDTAGTLCKCIDELYDKGATEVYACIPHGILSGVAYERIGNSKLKSLYISDTIPTKEVNDLGVKRPRNIKIVSCSDTISKIIKATRENSSVDATIKNMYHQHS